MIKDLVHESSTSTGAANFTLSAVNGKVRFSDPTHGFGTGSSNIFYYFISNRAAGEWERGIGYMSDANTLVRLIVLGSSNSGAAADFSSGTKDVANDKPAFGQSAHPSSLLGLITNPFFEVSQENGTTLLSAIASGIYAADQWYSGESGATLVCSAQNVTTPFSSAGGFRRLQNSLKVISTTAQASLASGELLTPCHQSIEGTFWRTLGWGGEDAQDVVVIAIMQASVTGTYSVALRNGAENRSYVTTVALTANTPTVIYIEIPGDISGTWATDTGVAAKIAIAAVTGSTYETSTLDTWQAGNYLSADTSTDWQGTTNAFIQIAYCNIFPKGVLPWSSASEISGEALQTLLNMRRPYDDELRRCRRYFVQFGGSHTNESVATAAMVTATAAVGTITLPTSMRVDPSVSYSALSDWSIDTGSNYAANAILIPANGSATRDRYSLRFQTATSLTAGAAVLLTAKGTLNARLKFNARM